MISLITADGQRFRLAWTRKKFNLFNLGCVYFKDEGERVLWPDEFKDWHVGKGAIILCSNDMERHSVAGALGVNGLGLGGKCIVTESPF